MKHFIIEIIYKVPLEKVNEVLPLHREYLKTGYEKSIMLASGRQASLKGGILIARANSEEEIREFSAKDPYYTNGCADYRFIEFNPVLHQEFLNDWIEGK